MLWWQEGIGTRPLSHNRSIQGVALPEVQCVHRRSWRHDRDPAESIGLPDAVSDPVDTSGPYTKGGRPRDTPTPSECEEIQDGYQEAFDFWLKAQFRTYSEKRYNATAERFDELPGVSGYFRFLCLHTVTKEGKWYVLRRTH
jgi:hypothetical protein